jgi:hypothetical protein
MSEEQDEQVKAKEHAEGGRLMDQLRIGSSLSVLELSAWLGKHGYLVVVSQNGRAFTFGRPGEPAVIAPTPCVLVWDGTKVYLNDPKAQ